MPKDSISHSSIPCPYSSNRIAKGYEHLQLLRGTNQNLFMLTWILCFEERSSFLYKFKHYSVHIFFIKTTCCATSSIELVGVLIQRGLLYCSATDGKQPIIAVRNHDSSTVEYCTIPTTVDDTVYGGMTKVTPLESTISLPSDLEAAVYRALSVGNRSDSQPLKLMFSVCQALGLLGYVLLLETRTEGKKEFTIGGLLGSEKEDLGSNQSNISTRNDSTLNDYVDVDNRLQSHESVLQIITIMTVMLRQGVVKVAYYFILASKIISV